VRVAPDMLTTLQVAYRREAQDAIRKYHMDSLANGLRYDRHAEELIVERLEPLLRQAGQAFMDQPSKDLIGEWLRALAADPDAPRYVRGPTRIPVKARDDIMAAARESAT
jgi:glucosyl-3-phosphoglycerate synthase